MMFFVDRIEDGIAVLEDEHGTISSFPVSSLPEGIREGSVLKNGQNGDLYIDNKTEDDRRKELFDLQNSLFDE